MKRATVVLLGPSRQAISGVSTHLRFLLGSALAQRFRLEHFQVGSEGRAESALQRAARLAASPVLLAFTLLRLGADLVHINTTLDARAYWRDLAYLAVAKLCGARVVYQVHGGALPGEFLRGRLPSAWLQATLRWPDAVVVLARVELAAYRRFVPGQTVVLLPNGIDPAPFARPERAAARAGGPLRLIYLGRLAPRKGVYEALDALHAARAQGLDARLVIVGSGTEEAALRARVQALGLSRQVRFAGTAEGDEKARLLAEADVLLLTSYSEGLPYALLEAMAAGTVPVVSPVGAMPDVVADQVHGRVVPPGDAAAIVEALLGLERDRAALARMSAACRGRVASEYSIGRVTADFAELYGGLCATRTPREAL